MPTARELLEQADALMRRNRGGEPGVPVLTEHVADALGETLFAGAIQIGRASCRERVSVVV